MIIMRNISEDFRDDICEHLGRIRKIAKDIEKRLEDEVMDTRDSRYTDYRHYDERRYR